MKILVLFTLLFADVAFAKDISCPSALADVYSYVQEAKANYNAGLQSGDYWLVDKTTEFSHINYNGSFSGVLESGDFRTHFISRKNQGLTNNVLELFGSGIFVEPDTFTTMTSVRILPQLIDEHFFGPQRREIYGNVWSKRTFIDIKRSMTRRKIAAFDVIVARPFAGIVEDSVGFLPATLALLNRYYSLLAPQGEIIVTRPLRASININPWLDLLSHTPGLRVYRSDLAIRIVKEPAAPAKLPEL